MADNHLLSPYEFYTFGEHAMRLRKKWKAELMPRAFPYPETIYYGGLNLFPITYKVHMLYLDIVCKKDGSWGDPSFHLSPSLLSLQKDQKLINTRKYSNTLGKSK